MPDFATTQRAAVAHQIRRCLSAMTDKQINDGLTAFDNGASNWSNCFWARVFKGQANLGAIYTYTARDRKTYSGTKAIEWWIADQLGLESNMPVRIVYNLFDGVSRQMTRADLGDFIRKARLEGDDSGAVLDLLASINTTNLSNEPDWHADLCGSDPSGV